MSPTPPQTCKGAGGPENSGTFRGEPPLLRLIAFEAAAHKKRVMRRSLLLLLLVWLTTTACAPAVQAAERPNVLILLADDMRPDAIAALGHPVIKTATLDALVRRGFAFNSAYCMGSTMGAVCNPSRHMLLSGMSLYRYDPQKKEETFGDVFRRAGYVTWHLGKKGNTAREYHKAFEFSDYLEDQKERTSGHHGRAVADRAVEFLKTGWKQDKPLLMHLAFEGPHDPRVAAEEWMSLYERDKIPLPENFRPFHEIDNGWLAGRDEKLAAWPRTEAEVRQHLHDYYACITSIDHHCGRVLQALEELGQLENTLVIFTSDHGLAVGSHGLFGKQNLYEHSMRSPLVFAGPGVPHGSSDALAYLFDIFPTTCELAGVPTPEGLDGRSQAAVIRGEQPAVREEVFLAFEQGQRAVRQGDWKLYRFPLVNHSLLFNLQEDPHELHNLAEDPAQAERVRDLMALLEQQQKLYGDPHPHTSPKPGKARIDLSYFENPPNPAPSAKRPRSAPPAPKP
jgi:arylsulfatase A-like enzyme